MRPHGHHLGKIPSENQQQPGESPEDFLRRVYNKPIQSCTTCGVAFSEGARVVESPAPSAAPAERRASLWFWGVIAAGTLAVAVWSRQ